MKAKSGPYEGAHVYAPLSPSWHYPELAVAQKPEMVEIDSDEFVEVVRQIERDQRIAEVLQEQEQPGWIDKANRALALVRLKGQLGTVGTVHWNEQNDSEVRWHQWKLIEHMLFKQFPDAAKEDLTAALNVRNTNDPADIHLPRANLTALEVLNRAEACAEFLPRLGDPTKPAEQQSTKYFLFQNAISSLCYSPLSGCGKKLKKGKLVLVNNRTFEAICLDCGPPLTGREDIIFHPSRLPGAASLGDTIYQIATKVAPREAEDKSKSSPSPWYMALPSDFQLALRYKLVEDSLFRVLKFTEAEVEQVLKGIEPELLQKGGKKQLFDSPVHGHYTADELIDLLPKALIQRGHPAGNESLQMYAFREDGYQSKSIMDFECMHCVTPVDQFFWFDLSMDDILCRACAVIPFPESYIQHPSTFYQTSPIQRAIIRRPQLTTLLDNEVIHSLVSPNPHPTTNVYQDTPRPTLFPAAPRSLSSSLIDNHFAVESGSQNPRLHDWKMSNWKMSNPIMNMIDTDIKLAPFRLDRLLWNFSPRKEIRILRGSIQSEYPAPRKSTRSVSPPKHQKTDPLPTPKAPQPEAPQPSTEEDKDTCCICLDLPRSWIAIPCGHYSFCGDCIKTLDKCAVCRLKIVSKHKVF